MIKGSCKIERMALEEVANILRTWEGGPTPKSWKKYYENQNRELWRILKKVKSDGDPSSDRKKVDELLQINTDED